jgi:hypothetical protein
VAVKEKQTKGVDGISTLAGFELIGDKIQNLENRLEKVE